MVLDHSIRSALAPSHAGNGWDWRWRAADHSGSEAAHSVYKADSSTDTGLIHPNRKAHTQSLNCEGLHLAANCRQHAQLIAQVPGCLPQSDRCPAGRQAQVLPQAGGLAVYDAPPAAAHLCDTPAVAGGAGRAAGRGHRAVTGPPGGVPSGAGCAATKPCRRFHIDSGRLSLAKRQMRCYTQRGSPVLPAPQG